MLVETDKNCDADGQKEGVREVSGYRDAPCLSLSKRLSEFIVF